MIDDLMNLKLRMSLLQLERDRVRQVSRKSQFFCVHCLSWVVAIRCSHFVTWLSSIHTYTPTRQQVAAAWSQEEFYEKSWNQNFDYWYDLYLREAGLLDGNVTTMDMREAFEGALYQATGRGGCQANRAGTSWFFFTVMTSKLLLIIDKIDTPS